MPSSSCIVIANWPSSTIVTASVVPSICQVKVLYLTGRPSARLSSTLSVASTSLRATALMLSSSTGSPAWVNSRFAAGLSVTGILILASCNKPPLSAMVKVSMDWVTEPDSVAVSVLATLSTPDIHGASGICETGVLDTASTPPIVKANWLSSQVGVSARTPV